MLLSIEQRSDMRTVSMFLSMFLSIERRSDVRTVSMLLSIERCSDVRTVFLSIERCSDVRTVLAILLPKLKFELRLEKVML